MGKQHRLVRFVGWGLEVSIRRRGTAETRRVCVPCRPTVEVLQMELASRLLMAALLECRDAGLLQLRLADNRRDWGARITDPELRTLAEACGQAVDRWSRVTLANQNLCDALLADCTDSITPPTDDEDFAWPRRRGGASRGGRMKGSPDQGG